MKEDDQAFIVKADMPGLRKEDIQIDVDDDEVTLSAETKQEKEEKEGENVGLQRAQLRHGSIDSLGRDSF